LGITKLNNFKMNSIIDKINPSDVMQFFSSGEINQGDIEWAKGRIKTVKK